jgi:hypothetical protein
MRLAQLCLTAALLACSGGSGASPAPRTAAAASPEGSASGETAASAEAAPEAGASGAAHLTAAGAPVLAPPGTPRAAQSGDAPTRCARIAALCLEDAARMMSFLGASDEASRAAVERLRPAYGAGFVERCAAAPSDVLTCVETAENAFTGLARCGVNRARGFSEALIVGDAFGFEVRWAAEERAVTDAAGAAALRAAMVGSWSLRDRDTWTFTAEGRGSHAQPGGALADSYQFTATGRAHLVSDPIGYWSAVVDGDVLYLNGTGGGAGYAEARPIDEDGWTVAVSFGLWAVRDLRGTPRCTGFSWWGQPVETAECAWEGEGEGRRLRIMAGFGHDLLGGEPASPYPVRLRELSGHLVGNNDLHFYRRVP